MAPRGVPPGSAVQTRAAGPPFTGQCAAEGPPKCRPSPRAAALRLHLVVEEVYRPIPPRPTARFTPEKFTAVGVPCAAFRPVRTSGSPIEVGSRGEWIH